MSANARIVVLAAGKGTRMKSELPKVLHKVGEKSILAWVVDAALSLAPKHVHVVVGHESDLVREFLDERYDDTVSTVVQEQQLGTGHAVQVALKALGEEQGDTPILVVTGDAPLVPASKLKELIDQARDSKSGMALASGHTKAPIPYGRLVRDHNGTLLRIVEYGDASDAVKSIPEVNLGFYAVRLDVLRTAISELKSDNAQKEFYLTDIAAQVAPLGGAATVHMELQEAMGINTRHELAQVERYARQTINRQLMENGVTLIDPESTFIGAEVEVGQDAVIYGNVHLRQKTTIGPRAVIDTGSVITNCDVAEDAWIKPYSILTDSSFGASCQIGPFTHCRPKTTIEEGAKVGNFVETKKSHIMAGAKANHLAYLGDAVIGKRSNIGAGTITCNYDGFGKHRTIVEEGAFIGSDSQLVAPVTIGRDAYVGSGTTVTKDVPRSALALSRTKQVNIDGWADRFRKAHEMRESRRKPRDTEGD